MRLVSGRFPHDESAADFAGGQWPVETVAAITNVVAAIFASSSGRRSTEVICEDDERVCSESEPHTIMTLPGTERPSSAASCAGRRSSMTGLSMLRRRRIRRRLPSAAVAALDHSPPA